MGKLLIVGAAAAFLLSGCGKEKNCETAAEMVQQCVERAKDESVEELAGECETALENERGWAQASIDCAAEHSDCEAFTECVEQAE